MNIDPNTIIFILGILTGFNTGWNFSDFDEWVISRIPKDFRNTFTFYVVSRMLKAIHHYMLGLLIVVLFYPPHSLLSLFCLGFGLGLFIEEADVFVSDMKKIGKKLKLLKES